MNPLYKFTKYKAFIKTQIEAHREIRGYQAQLARAAGCQKTYLSQVMNGKVQLTPEHALGLARFWGMNEGECEYFLDLVHYERAGTKTLEDYFLTRITTKQRLAADLKRSMPRTSVPSQESQLRYYSQALGAAVHVLVSIPGLRKPSQLANRLRMDEKQISAVLQGLLEINVVEKRGDEYFPLQHDFHLPAGSPLANNHHNNWRQYSMMKMYQPAEDDVRYTGLHALSRKDADQIRALVRELIVRVRGIIGPSPEEDAIMLNIDLLRL